MDYVTYNTSGALTGGYCQDLQPEHEGAHIEVTPEQRLNWTDYRANAARDGIELAPIVTPLTTVEQYTAALQSMLDTEARTRHYDGILSACTYATSTVPQFAGEGQACVVWRDAVWSTSYAIMAEVESGARPAPTIAELIALMPAMEWPA